jgi:hypothetical protein
MAKKISPCYPEYVFQRLGAGKDVDAVDFKKKAYVDLDGQTVLNVQQLVIRATNDKDVQFFQIEEETAE